MLLLPIYLFFQSGVSGVNYPSLGDRDYRSLSVFFEVATKL